MEHDEAVLLFDRHAGRLDPALAARLDAHLAECGECRALDAVCPALVAAVKEEEDVHPAPDEIVDHALGRGGPGDNARVAGHVRDCPTCAEEVARVREVERDIAGSARIPAWRSWFVTPTPLWALAAAAVLLAALAYPAFRWLQDGRSLARTSVELQARARELEARATSLDDALRGARTELERARTWSGSLPLQFLSGTVRGIGEETVVRVDPAQPFVALGIELDPPAAARDDDSLRFTFRRDGGEVVYAADLPLEAVRREIRSAGVVTFVIAGARLPPGPYTLEMALSGPRGVQPLLPRRFRVDR